MSKPRKKSDSAAVLFLSVMLHGATAPADRLRLCALIGYRLGRITSRDTRLGKSPHKEKR